MLNLLILSIILIIFIEKSDIIDTLKNIFEFILTIFNCKKLIHIWTIAGKPFKPFECCFCMISWTTIFYCIFIQQSAYLFIYGIMLAYFSDVISEILDLIKGLLQTIITKIENYLC